LLRFIRPYGLPTYACHDVASAKAGRSRPRGSIRVLAKKGETTRKKSTTRESNQSA